MSNWKSEGLEAWVIVSRRHARIRPLPPPSVPASFKSKKQLISKLLGVQEGQETVIFVDYAKRLISRKTQELCAKLLKDEAHTAYAGWIAETLRNPIEVWERIENGIAKLHYYAAYVSSPTSTVVSYMAVAVVSNGTLITAFQKDSAKAIDDRRDGKLLFRSYS